MIELKPITAGNKMIMINPEKYQMDLFRRLLDEIQFLILHCGNYEAGLATLGDNIHEFFSAKFSLPLGAFKVMLIGRRILENETFRRRLNHKLFVMNYNLVGGRKDIKVILPNERCYNFQVKSKLHYMQIYNDISERFVSWAENIVLKKNGIIKKPEDLIRGNYQPVNVEFFIGKDDTPRVTIFK
jgi:hypothetical protein